MSMPSPDQSRPPAPGRCITEPQFDGFIGRFNELASVAALAARKGVSTDVVMQQWEANHGLASDLLKALGAQMKTVVKEHAR